MSTDAALAELKADFGKARSIPVQAAAPYIAKTPGAAYKLAQRERFPIPVRKVQANSKSTYMVSLYDLAEFIGGAGGAEPQGSESSGPVSGSTAKRPSAKGTKPAAGAKKPRLPAMSKMMRAMVDRMDETRMHLDLLHAVYAEMEALEMRKASKEPKAPAKRVRPRPL